MKDKCSVCGFVIEDGKGLYSQSYLLTICERGAGGKINTESPIISQIVLCIKCKKSIDNKLKYIAHFG